jgi:hypothetical protein
MPAEEACFAPGNARGAAWVAEADVTTRTKSVATTTFLIVDALSCVGRDSIELPNY